MTNPLERLADSLIDDVLHMSDGEILDELRDDGIEPSQLADQMRAIFETAVIVAHGQAQTKAPNTEGSGYARRFRLQRRRGTGAETEHTQQMLTGAEMVELLPVLDTLVQSIADEDNVVLHVWGKDHTKVVHISTVDNDSKD